MRGLKTCLPYSISNSTCTLIRSSSSPPLIDVAGAAAIANAADSLNTGPPEAPTPASLMNVTSPRLTPARLA